MSPRRIATLLIGAWLGAPLAVGAMTAATTTSVSCDTNGLAVIAATTLVGLVLATAWSTWFAARFWLLAVSAAGAALLVAVASFAT
jgi:hypothetical protein